MEKISKVKFEYIPFTKLVFLENNPRTRTQKGIERMAADIKKDPSFYENRPTLVNVVGGEFRVYAGDLRAHAAHDVLGWESIPCNLESDVPNDVQARRAILDNTHHENWDSDLLANWGFDVDELGEMSVPGWVYGVDESEGGAPNNALNSEAQEDDFEVPEVETVKTDIVLGDLFEIGPHRLLCGDSTKAEDVEKLMGGEKADMVFTDPPYNIASDSNNFAADVSKSMGDLKDSDWDKSFNIEDGLSNLIGAVKKDFTAYIWTSHFLFQRILDIFKGFDYVSYLIWAKPNPMPSLSKRHPTWNTEMCVYVSSGSKRAVNFPEEGHFLSCRVVAKNSDGSHPTQKPILLVAPILSFSSNKWQVVLDLFLGSGTTMVAAHQLSRKCYGMELSEKYCQVIVDRMLKLDPTLEVKKNGVLYERKN